MSSWKLMGCNADTDNQRVIIKVKDINDEPPYFINRPLPMQVYIDLDFNHTIGLISLFP